MKKIINLFFIGALVLSGALFTTADNAIAQVTYDFTAGPGLGIAVPDNGYDGTLGSMASSQINVPPGIGTITNVTVDVDMSHTWIGDLTIKLQSPSGTLVTMLSRPGYTEVADDGSDCCGTSSDFAIGTPITYDDASLNDAEAMTGTPVGQGGSPSDYFPNGDQAALPHNLAAFINEIADGTWTLYVGDGAGLDLGTIDGWTLHITAAGAVDVPTMTEWGMLIFLLLAGLMSVYYVRRQKTVS